jgi:hypothetical protein
MGDVTPDRALARQIDLEQPVDVITLSDGNLTRRARYSAEHLISTGISWKICKKLLLPDVQCTVCIWSDERLVLCLNSHSIICAIIDAQSLLEAGRKTTELMEPTGLGCRLNLIRGTFVQSWPLILRVASSFSWTVMWSLLILGQRVFTLGILYALRGSLSSLGQACSGGRSVFDCPVCTLCLHSLTTPGNTNGII